MMGHVFQLLWRHFEVFEFCFLWKRKIKGGTSQGSAWDLQWLVFPLCHQDYYKENILKSLNQNTGYYFRPEKGFVTCSCLDLKQINSWVWNGLSNADHASSLADGFSDLPNLLPTLILMADVIFIQCFLVN